MTAKNTKKTDMKAEMETSKLEQLAQAMASFNFMQGKKVSYSQIERFLKKSLETGPMLVFSVPNDKDILDKKSDLSAIRIDWNKRAYGGHYKKDIVDKAVINVFHTDFDNFTFVREKIAEDDLVLFKIGESNNQRFFGLFREEVVIEDTILSLFSLFMNNVSKGWTLLDELRKVESLIHVDDVTGLYNQRKLLKDINMAISRHNELKEEFSVLFIDIDHFKQVNDGHGHLVGTQLLTIMGDLLKKTLRESDLIYRYGGDEFVMLIPDVGHEIGKVIGHRVLEAVKNEVFKIKHHDEKGEDIVTDFKLTVSIGVATFPQDAKTREDILSIADRMMYEAKKNGRGRVCFTSDLLEK